MCIHNLNPSPTFVTRSELFHCCWKSFIEPLLLRDKWLTDSAVIILHHAHMSSNLVDEWFQQDSFFGFPDIQIILHHHDVTRDTGVFFCWLLLGFKWRSHCLTRIRRCLEVFMPANELGDEGYMPFGSSIILPELFCTPEYKFNS